MSCIRFNTQTQRDQFAFADCDAEPVSAFLSPQLTEGKLLRLHGMAVSDNPKIRESAALSAHLPDKTYALLAKDEEASVRRCIARNKHTPSNVLESLIKDSDEAVRGFLIANPTTHHYIVLGLLFDPSERIRSLAKWRLSPK